jgi:uncharacterized membrane protein YeaQ/YmgE (transglycosylase-associated protein family)
MVSRGPYSNRWLRLPGAPTGSRIRTSPGERIPSMLGLILYLLIIGIVAGYLARFLVPGRDPMGFLGTVALGIVGSFVGGFLGYVLLGKDIGEGALQTSGIIGSIIGAIVALLIWRGLGGRGRSVGHPLTR